MVIYGGQDYRISFCAEPELGDKIEFKLKDSKTNDVLYDNTIDEYVQKCLNSLVQKLGVLLLR